MTSTSRVLRALAPRQIATLTLLLLAAFMLTVSQALAHNVTAGDAGYIQGTSKNCPVLGSGV